jgi:arsenate reductase (glutaredoxin)
MDKADQKIKHQYKHKMKVTILHNNKCSKSRCALQILKANNIEYEVVDYLKNTPTHKELKLILAKLGAKPSEIIRKGEIIYKEKFSKFNFTEDEWLDILIENPALIERPIIINGNKATIGRTDDKIYNVLNIKL